MSNQNESIEEIEINEKYSVVIKWSIYFLASSMILSFVFVFFRAIFSNVKVENTLLILNFLVLIYCTYKCYQENKNNKISLKFSIVNLITQIFIIKYFFNFLIFYSGSPFIIPKRELEIKSGNEDLSELNSNILCDFIAYVKNKL